MFYNFQKIQEISENDQKTNMSADYLGWRKHCDLLTL